MQHKKFNYFSHTQTHTLKEPDQIISESSALCMYVCVHVFANVCMHACMPVCVCVCVHVFVHVYVCMHASVYVCVCVHAHVCVCGCPLYANPSYVHSLHSIPISGLCPWWRSNNVNCYIDSQTFWAYVVTAKHTTCWPHVCEILMFRSSDVVLIDVTLCCMCWQPSIWMVYPVSIKISCLDLATIHWTPDTVLSVWTIRRTNNQLRIHEIFVSRSSNVILSSRHSLLRLVMAKGMALELESIRHWLLGLLRLNWPLGFVC